MLAPTDIALTHNTEGGPIASLKQLVAVLKKTETSNFLSVAQHIMIDPSTITPYTLWSEDHHTRVCIEHNARFELILICWQPGQKTAIHDHNSEECWMHFVQGEFEEVIYNHKEGQLIHQETKHAAANSVTYMTDFIGVHSLHNVGAERGLSLHLYAKPITSCNIFKPSIGTFLKKEMHYDSHVNVAADAATIVDSPAQDN
ncbi:MAG: cysteine dioxygenase family protein [Porticoccaceae bacterium]|nr:cysteine dioxygenase family protein [Porticoccaceae bacterium]MDG1473360.1 cysteine dioxygenase family protein [Porticoccaceae bacterium]